MTLDEAIKEAKITAVTYENEARKCIQHGGTFYEEKAKAFRESAKEFEQVAEWLEELKAYREVHGTADRADGKEQRMSDKTDKKEYCVAEQLGTICYHQNTEFCQLCKRNHDERIRFLQEIGIAITKRSRR